MVIHYDTMEFLLQFISRQSRDNVHIFILSILDKKKKNEYCEIQIYSKLV